MRLVWGDMVRAIAVYQGAGALFIFARITDCVGHRGK